jgi:Uri superfamily endonuclease
MRLPHHVNVVVGKLGRFDFPPGWYAYPGSARGPGGLAARVSRHLRTSKTFHWHVDYLRAHTELTAVWYAVGSQKRECDWALALSALPQASRVAPGFGASDCRCATHLLHFSEPPNHNTFVHSVHEPISEDVFNE